MQKKFSIQLDEKIYSKLCQVIGKRKISRFVEDLIKPYITKKDTDEIDRSRELQAILWSEAIF